MIGLDKNGNAKATILEKAHKKGLATGLVSDTRLTHATPASFAAHVATRFQEDEIAEHMISSGADILFSGGFNRFIPKNYDGEVPEGFSSDSRRKDEKNLLEAAKKNGYSLVFDKTAMDKASGKKVLGLFTHSDMPDGIWQSKNRKDPKRKVPTLLDMTKVAVKKLAKNKKGYFLMVEGGQIDWAGHANDAGTMLHEMISFNETLHWLLNWIDNHPDTLLVVTADHETGSFGMGYNVHNTPQGVPLSGEAFKGRLFKPNLNYASYETIDKMYEQKISLKKIWKEFKKLPRDKRNPRQLQKMMNDNLSFSIDLKQARYILQDKSNRYYDPSVRSRKAKVLPNILDFDSFYFGTDYSRTALMSRALSAQQNVVWGTGGHTATPVFVMTYGRKKAREKFKGYLNHPRVGQLMQEALGL